MNVYMMVTNNKLTEVKDMFKNINVQEQLSVLTGGKAMFIPTCPTSEVNHDSRNFDSNKAYIERIQLGGWSYPRKSGIFKENRFIGSLVSKSRTDLRTLFRREERVVAYSV